MGIGFEVIESPQKPIWIPVEGTTQLCVGQILYYGLATPTNVAGASPMVVPSGAGDISNLFVPYGIVVGTNDSADSETYSTLATANVTVKTITGVNTAAAQLARQCRGVEGMYAKGDQQAMVQVIRVTDETVIRGYFRNSATVGTTNITIQSPASGLSTTGMTFTTFGFTPVAENATLYGMTGVNAGLYRVTTGTSATALTNTRAFLQTPLTTDTYKYVNVRQGYCRMAFDTTYGLWIDNTAALTSNYYVVNVLALSLGNDPGNEFCDFSFSADHFNTLPQAGAR
jgi:hypothetical protein